MQSLIESVISYTLNREGERIKQFFNEGDENVSYTLWFGGLDIPKSYEAGRDFFEKEVARQVSDIEMENGRKIRQITFSEVMIQVTVTN